MLANNFSSISGYHPSAQPSSTKLPLNTMCLVNKPNVFVFGTFNIINIFLLLPLSIFILCHGRKQQKKRSTSSAALISHSDTLTHHVVLMELIGIIGCTLNFWAVCSFQVNVFSTGIVLFTFSFIGEVFFHVFTCVDRYLAVVHPIIYLHLKKERGIRLRNICIGCAWLLCILITGLLSNDNAFMVMEILLIVLSLITVSFCSLSVLCVLIGPGPGEQGGGRKRADRSKQKAFYIIMSILGLLLLKLIWDLCWAVLFTLGDELNCLLITCNLWLKLPSSLLLPLIFLQKAGKLACCQT